MSDVTKSREFRAALDALRECTLDELNEIELTRLRAIKLAVGLRERFAAKTLTMPTLRLIPRPEPTLSEPPVPDPAYLAGAADGKLVQDEDDEPDDQDATPLEVVDPLSDADVIEAQAFFRADGGHEPRGPHN